MASKKAGLVDIVFHDDRKGGNATLSVVDKAGQPTTMPNDANGNPLVPVWTSSSPAIVPTPAADGMSAVLALSTPPQLATGVVITATATETDGTTLSGVGDPIDVAGGAAAGFVMQESESAS